MEQKKAKFEIIQPNRVIHARYHFTAIQEDVLTVAIDAIQQHITGEKPIQVDLFNNPIIKLDSSDIAKGNNKSYVLKQLHEMRKKDIEYEWERPSDGRTIKTNTGIFGAIHDIKETTFIEVEISKWAIPWLVFWGKIEGNSHNGFTKYLKATALILQGEYTKRLYKMCCRWQDKGGFSMSLQEFREWLQIVDKYPKPANIKVKILNPAQKEMKDKGDLYFEYTFEKVKSASFNFIHFKIISNKEYKDPNKQNTSELYRQVYNYLCRIYPSYTDNRARQICDYIADKALLKQILERFERLDDDLSSGKLNNSEHFNRVVKKILKEDYDISL